MLLLYFKLDNGSNVCGIEFNYNNNKKEKKEENKDLKSTIPPIPIFHQLFLGIEVESEEGR